MQASHSDSSTFLVPKEFISLCVRQVKTHLDRVRIERACEDFDSGVLLLKMITILAHVSLDVRHALGHDIELLMMCVECLKTVHAAGKTGADGCDRKNDFDSLAGNKVCVFVIIMIIMISLFIVTSNRIYNDHRRKYSSIRCSA